MAGAPSDEGAAKTRVSPCCLACGAAGVTNRCGGCRGVYFCDRECQKRAWVAHRPECQRIREAAARAEEDKPVSVDSDVRIPSADASVSISKQEANAASEAAMNEDLAEKESQQDDVVDGDAAAIEAEPQPSPPTASSSKKKSKSKHKRKKPRSKSLHLPSNAASSGANGSNQGGDSNASKNASNGNKKPRSVSLGARKHIMWGHVSAREFERFPGGGGAVPYDGTWALGLGSKVADVQLGSVLEVEEHKAEELKARAKELPKTQRALVREGETRQFDYRRGVDNPLFSRLSERERKQLFTSELSTSPSTKPSVKMSSSPPKHDNDHRHQSARRRKNSVSLSPALIAMSAPVIIEDAPLDAPDFACVSIEQLDEFAKIRDSRDAACGCSCGDLVKKVAKMNVRKLATFLHERGVEDTHGMGKPQLLALAKKMASEEKNCQTTDGDCECARNGVPCHSDVCEGCAGDCFNPFNRYEYKKDEVRAYRKQMIAAWRAQYQAEHVATADNGREPVIEASHPAAVQVA